MSEKSRCNATLDITEEADEVASMVTCERKYEHKGKHRETWWVGKGGKAFKVVVQWKRRKG